MNLPPWHKLVEPREDLRTGKPLDASAFAVHLEQVRMGDGPEVYVKPDRFFERTYPTKNLRALAAEVLRRLSGETVGASAVFNLTTQFGGGKTHALTMLYHLARAGVAAVDWPGVAGILEQAGLKVPPQAAVAVFVGQHFDPLKGRGGPGEPSRRTPWGEIAFQVGGEPAFQRLAEHDQYGVAPDAGTLREVLPADRPTLILMDEVMNYVARARTVPTGENRASNGATQFYVFLQNLTEAVRGQTRVALLVALQASEMEMTAEDEADYARLQKLLDRVAKAVLLSEGPEIAEIVRRRLFEWHGIPGEGRRVAAAYADWVREHRLLLPDWFPADAARAAFEATYPLHPTVLSVFERKWQVLPRFQRTRGILHLLGLWIAHAYQAGYRGAQRDPLLTLGTAPWEEALFRSAVFEQLGEERLEGAVTTDIAGDRTAHAVRLDEGAAEPLRGARLHRKVASAIFFESNGGQARGEASMGEVRLAVGEPDLDIGWVEQAVEALRESCYFLHADGGRYRFGVRPNLNKLLADRRATIAAEDVRTLAWERVQEVFQSKRGVRGDVRVVLGPERTGDIPDQPVLTLVVLRPERSMADEAGTRAFIAQCLAEHGASGRTFKNALVFVVAAGTSDLEDQARKCLAWRGLRVEQDRLALDEEQRRQLAEALRASERDLTESVWRTYRHLWLLKKDGDLRPMDLGLVHSSAAESLVALILGELERTGDVTAKLGPTQLVRHWPPALPEWSTEAVRDAVFASPQFPRLLSPQAIRETIVDGVARELFAYGVVGLPGGRLRFGEALQPQEVDIRQDSFIIPAEEARRRLAGPGEFGGKEPDPPTEPPKGGGPPGDGPDDRGEVDRPPLPPTTPRVTTVRWSGRLPEPQGKWSLFYRQVLMPLLQCPELEVSITLRAHQPAGLEASVLSDVKTALTELTGIPPTLEEL